MSAVGADRPDQRPVALGDHPGLTALLAALREQDVPVLPVDYLRIEQVFPPGRELPWSEARDLLADLLAKDTDAHEKVRTLFPAHIPIPRAETRSGGGEIAGPPRRSEADDQQTPRASPEPPETESRTPPPERPWIAYTATALVVLLLGLGALLWALGDPQPKWGEPLKKLPTPDGASARTLDKEPLPSEPIPRFHAWVPILEVQGPAAAPLWPAALLLIAGIAALGWLGQRLRNLHRPDRGLAEPRLRSGGPRVPAWTDDQWQPPVLLDRTRKRDLVWGVQRFTAERLTPELDMEATVAASARAAIPRPRYVPERRERAVWLWQDTRLQRPEVRALTDGIGKLLERAGLPVHRARFSGIPDPVWLDDHTPAVAEDLGPAARSALVLLVTDGEAMAEALAEPGRRADRLHRLLRELRTWPRLRLLALDGSGDEACGRSLGLPCVNAGQLPAWINERPIVRPEAAPASRLSSGQAHRWAALCALPGLPVTSAQCARLYHLLDLPATWSLPPPPGARARGGHVDFPPETRRALLQDLAERLWRLRHRVDNSARQPAGEGLAERELARALDFWQQELRRTEPSASTTDEDDRKRDSRGQHRTRCTRRLLDLWRPDPAIRAEAVAELYAHHRLYSEGSGRADRQQRRWLRGRLAGLGARGLAPSDERVTLPWSWQQSGERPADARGTTRARLLAMGFAGAGDGARRLPAPLAALALGATLGLVLAGGGWLLREALRTPTPKVQQRLARGEPVDPAGKSPRDRVFALGAADNGAAAGRLRARGPKLLVVSDKLAPDARVTLTWCWSNDLPLPEDGPCATLADEKYNWARYNALRTHDDDHTLLLRAGTLAEPIRACIAADRVQQDVEPWPALSVAVIQSPPQYPGSRHENEQAAQRAADARRLAIRLLDSGAVDLAIVGPDWRKEARQLAAERADPDSQWLFFTKQPLDAPPLPELQAPRQLWVGGDHAALALALREQRGVHPDPDRALSRLSKTDFPRAQLLEGPPARLWAGPAMRTHKLGDDTSVDFVHICPGTFTMGATDFFERRFEEGVRPGLGLRDDEELDMARSIAEDSIGAATRAALREALEQGLAASIRDDDWRGASTLGDAREAFDDWLGIARERPAHPVLMDGFWMARTETTNEQFAALPFDRLADAVPSKEHAKLRALWSRSATGEESLPLSEITWNWSIGACAALGGGLPSEVQWEYAARGGARTAWSWGDDPTLAASHAWFSENAERKPGPVGTKLANPMGLRHMHGNLWEWVTDCFDTDRYGPRAGGLTWAPEGDAVGCRFRVLRGGSFVRVPWGLRSAFRDGDVPERRNLSVGFRCVRSGAPALDNSTP